MKRFLCSLAFLILPGCAEMPEATPPPEAPRAELPPPKVAPREPGSLWSETSRWNDLYSPAPNRQVGDTIRIKLSEAMKAKLGGVNENAEQTPADERAAAASKSMKPDEGTILEATIREVQPRGIFVVGASQALRVGPREPRIYLEGNVRERDIDSDDTVSSDALFNLNLDAKLLADAQRKPASTPTPTKEVDPTVEKKRTTVVARSEAPARMGDKPPEKPKPRPKEAK